MAGTLIVDDSWPPGMLLRYLSGDDHPLAVLHGIMLASLLSLLGFWMPLAIAVIR